ncbi:hypothetical protein [Chiayiivirga flava]|uniref:Toxin CptA n=1 Tax=Chiayiivirga flava TaxID=659595 RepID=A0A7W8D305_9GAMM|nr:hypothetical protein [Chiayiivirga flava]MBB5206959.1 hypothetical protein [Chiayiivirga flava]
MSDTSSPPLRLDLTVSRWLDAALVAIGLLAAVSVWLSALPWIAVLLVPPLWLQARRALHRASAATLVLRADGSAAMLHASYSETAVQLREFVERGPLALLVLDLPFDAVRRIPCAPDTLDAATRRRVRLWAMHHAHRLPAREPAHV